MIESIQGIQAFIEEKSFFEVEDMNLILMAKATFLKMKDAYDHHTNMDHTIHTLQYTFKKITQWTTFRRNPDLKSSNQLTKANYWIKLILIKATVSQNRKIRA